jgi:DNA-binding winged helix-turn-helix (wHTH) protein
MALFYRFGSLRLDPEFEALYRGNEPRRVLEDAGGEHRIVTLPRRGYRFVGPVVKEESGDAAVTATAVAPTPTLADKPASGHCHRSNHFAFS